MYVYFIRANTANWTRVKIGYAKSVEARLANLQTGSPATLLLMGSIKCKDLSHARRIEKILHEMLRDYSVGGEWFTMIQALERAIPVMVSGTQEEMEMELMRLHGSLQNFNNPSKKRKKFFIRAAQQKRAGEAIKC